MAKKYIEISIDNTRLDFQANNANFSLTFTLEDNDDVARIQGARSERSITLPATKVNDGVFGAWWDVALDNLEAANFKQLSVLVDGIPVLYGRAQLVEVDTRQNKYNWAGDKYRVALYGDNADWFLRLKDVKLGDLDYSGEQHTFNSTTVTTGFLAEYGTTNFGYCIIKLKDWANLTNVHFSECTPFLFIRSILDKAFQSIGYTFTSNFFDTENFKRLILPTPLPEKYPDDFSEDFLNIAATKTVTQQTDPVGFAPVVFDTQTAAPNLSNPYNSGTGVYTAPSAGFYSVSFTIIFDNIPAPPPPTLVGVTIFVDGVQQSVTTLIGENELQPSDNGRLFQANRIVEANAGDTITVEVISTELIDITGGSLEIIGEALVQVGTLIRFEYLLRQYKVNDLIKGLTQMFNLVWETNPLLSSIVVEPKDSYIYKQRTPTVSTSFEQGFLLDNINDLSNKLDVSKAAKIKAVSDIEETFRFNFKSDDQTVETLEENQELKIYEGRYNFDQDRFKKAEKEIENAFFASTLHLFDPTIQAEGSDFTPLVPIIWPNDYTKNTTADEVDVENIDARILYFAGQRSGIDGTINFDNGTAVSIIALPSSFMVNYNDTTGQDPILSYGSVQINGVESFGLVRTFFIRDLARKRAGKQIEAFLYLTELDILNLSFRNKLLIKDNLYLLSKIENWSVTSDKTTKTILIYDQSDSDQDINNLQDSPTVGFLGQNIAEDE